MGLAEPRKRQKISHDPRNLSWTKDTSSYGQKLMQKQGWETGQALGARVQGTSCVDDAARLKQSSIGILFKDDNLGLGARSHHSNSSPDAARLRTGSDAFAGLLGRLNGKITDAELEKMNQKAENKKLAMWTQGRWGGMTFVPGGVLVQSDKHGEMDEAEGHEGDQSNVQILKPAQGITSEDYGTISEPPTIEDGYHENEQLRPKQRLKLEKKARKMAKKADNTDVELSQQTVQGNISRGSTMKPSNDTSIIPVKAKYITNHVKPSGRHLLRAKHIQAKKMVFSDLKGLDEILMTRT